MLRQVPFFKLLIPFVLGIILSLNFSGYLSGITLIIVMAICPALVIWGTLVSDKWHLRWVFGLITTLVLTFAGFIITKSYLGSTTLTSELEQNALVKILEPPDYRTSSYRAVAKVLTVKTDGVWVSKNEKVMLYFSSSDSLLGEQKYGSILTINASFNPPPEPLNPHQFNHRQYLERKQIYQTAYIAPEKWMFLQNQPSIAKRLALDLRDKLLTLYKNAGIEGKNLAVLSALTMGYKNLLDQETRKVFSASGAMHILAVSGLHVGIFFTTLSGLLFFLSRTKRGKLLKSIILIAFLWGFAFFTGLSPSVVRASLMFSLVIVGVSLSRTTNVYNTLSASAFIILVFNPMLIIDIGFQLSYCAVLSIVFFYPHIYNLIFIKNRLINRVWMLIAVSIAAQIGTFPLSLYYFSQFPNYFLLANLYAIPLAFLILYAAIGLIMLSPIPIVFKGFAWLLDVLLTVLNYLTKYTESLPYSTSTALAITPAQLLLLCTSIVLIALFIHSKKQYLLLISLPGLMAFFGLNLITYFETYNKSEFLVFANRSASLMAYRHKGQLLLFSNDTTAVNLHDKYSFALQGYINKNRIKPHRIISERLANESSKEIHHNNLAIKQNDLGYWIEVNHKIMLIPMAKTFPYADKKQTLTLDFILLNADSPKIDDVLAILTPNTLVVDQTVSPWEIERISKIVLQKGIRLHEIGQQGAFSFY